MPTKAAQKMNPQPKPVASEKPSNPFGKLSAPKNSKLDKPADDLRGSMSKFMAPKLRETVKKALPADDTRSSAKFVLPKLRDVKGTIAK